MPAALRDILLLTAVCAFVFVVGPTTRGLANWQEAQRALVAREMQQSGDWIVPTIDGRPYLNKPPLFYWLTVAIAEVRGSRVGELDLRLAVALCGWAGVIATYLTAGRLVASLSTPQEPVDAAYPRRAALWSALFLATGVLYVRSSRMGELDAAIVPFAVAAIALVHEAWITGEGRARTSWFPVAAAAVCASGAALAKGPPALLVIALAAYGGVAVHAAITVCAEADGARRDAWVVRAALGYLVGAVAFMAAGVWYSWSESGWGDRISGLLLLDPMGGLVGALAALLLSRHAAGALWTVLRRTHPVAVLGLPVAALWIWLAVAQSRVGTDPVAGTIRGEAADNVRPFVLGAPLNNLEGATYGVGVGSVAALIACVWLVRTRPRITPGLAIVGAWIVLGLITFSVLGKGVPRYLTPVWPAIAILGGAWFASRPRGVARPLLTRALVIGSVGALALGQTYWYGIRGAERSHSPRDLIAELLAPPRSADPARLGTFEFDTPQVDFYAEHAVESYLDVTPRRRLAGVGPSTIADLRERLVREGVPFVLLVRSAQPSFLDPEPAIDRLRAAGLELDLVEVNARWRIDNDRTDVLAVRVRAGR